MEGEQALFVSLLSITRGIFAHEGNPGICSLRSQLCMALHDRQGDPALPPDLRERARALLARDECAALCAVLEQCVRDGHFDAARTDSLVRAVEKLEGPAKEALVRLASARRHARPVITDDGGSDSEGGVSAVAGGRVDDAGLKWLADAGMLLFDPPVFHLLLHETARSGGRRLPRSPLSPSFLSASAAAARPCL